MIVSQLSLCEACRDGSCEACVRFKKRVLRIMRAKRATKKEKGIVCMCGVPEPHRAIAEDGLMRCTNCGCH